MIFPLLPLYTHRRVDGTGGAHMLDRICSADRALHAGDTDYAWRVNELPRASCLNHTNQRPP